MEQSKFYQIKNITEQEYTLVGCDGSVITRPILDVDKSASAFTIRDAKDGDVLICKGNIKNSNGIKYERICLFNNLNNAFFTLTKTSNFVEEYDIDVNIDYPDNTVPATKEQKEILFMAMANAGYTFDFKKKELKEIEQKPTDKIEPKFKIGDWIINPKTGNVLQIKNVLLCGNKGNYEFDYSSMPIESVDKHYHLWTIEDAKDGDVLACKDELILFKSYDNKNLCYYCWYNGQTNNFFPKDTHTSRPRLDIIVPATKEQRDLLFRKMNEAGYEWDAEKKELKKINSYCQENCKGFQETGKCFADGECKAKREAEQKPAWSEEDEELLKWSINNLTELKDRFGEEYGKVGKCIDWVKSLKNRVQPKPKQEWSEEDEDYLFLLNSICKDAEEKYRNSPDVLVRKEIANARNWLKSLRPQNRWKPSDGDIIILEKVIKGELEPKIFQATLQGILEQLKKLKEGKV